MILASASPRRLELLGRVGLVPRVAPQDVDEKRLEDEHPIQLVERLARSKCAAALANVAPETGELVLAADTIVWAHDECLGKPSNAAEAAEMLRSLSGREHHVSTGVALARGGSDNVTSFVETADVEFFDLTEAQVAAYASSGEGLDKAGAYGIQGTGRLLVRQIRGDWDCVVGLPVARLLREIDMLGGTDHLTELLKEAHA